MKKRKNMNSYLTGTSQAGVAATGTNMGGMNSLYSAIPAVLDGIIDLAENNPKAYSKQPTVNMNVMRNVFSPYAYGGDVSDLGEDEMAQLQQMADDNGISVEELIAQLSDQSEGVDVEELVDPEVYAGSDDTEENEFAAGGVVKRNGKNPFKRTRLNLPQNTREWNRRGYATGGGVPINVEDNEVVETPNGEVQQMDGATHEEGGIDIAVPGGTKVFSDRLQVDGKTMQERKLIREKQESKIQKALTKNPTDALLKNSLKRTLEVNQLEEAKDMQLQTVAKAIMDNTGEQKFAYGGDVEGEDPYDPFNVQALFAKYKTPTRATTIPYSPGYVNTPMATVPVRKTGVANTGIVNNSANKVVNTPAATGVEDKNYDAGFNLTAGDWVGLAGNAFNAVMPLANTLAQRGTDKPNVNRFRGFGRNAILANDEEQNIAAKTKSAALTDLNTSKGSSYLRNRNSAMGVNTVRALDIATDMAGDKAANGIDNSFVKLMMGALDKRSSLENAKDSAEMKGETIRDTEDKADKDAFATAIGQNLTNMGTNVQGIGRSLNRAKSNQVNMNLLSQLSQYGLGFDKNGKLITI